MGHASEKRILVVDDEPDVRIFIATFLEDAGFDVETAENGEEALDKIRSYKPDLMTLDMVMPRKSGIEVMRTLRKDKRWAMLPVIIITAHARDEFGSEDIKSFNAFTSGLKPRYTMEKPVTPEKLVNAISEILEVEIVETAFHLGRTGSQKNDLVNMIEQSDPETLAKIKSLLNNP